ncbi:MAG TPA: response regulator transcription factor [Candidatus Dormibacteraeota bacterium]|nr:response regulator transcription factor [Candidatus Dormibacteraeota bacterium]
MIKVLIAEDQAMIRGALAALLAIEADIEVVAQVDRGDKVVEAAVKTTPDVALLDIEMPGQDGITAAAELRKRLPSCQVLILTVFGRPGYLRRAVDAGINGFLLKDAPPDELAAAIRRTARGEKVIDSQLAVAALSEGSSPLTPRERDVLALSTRGASVEEIARSLHLTNGTVRNHLSIAIQKLNSRNRVEAARIAEEKGWL